ncbi:chain length determinant family protein [Myxococcus stipitatus DSM 14675]|uniref:Chain length determinant family protein n=1 Tax=Myxococcus stipitatus (strain DSM 14675 / JCM 12634 / Mx s8) TaxID=1278073 RepID=L7URU1_MYXSD|nr:PCP family exopolysaccharide biosynthesis protein EpsV [Myxococcus stipitatus]AGC49339.1 chain length determinant family protein [Myxococcus stipitatus DSM 14675]
MTVPAPGQRPGPHASPAFTPERVETNAPSDLIDWGFAVDSVFYLKNAVLRHWFLALVVAVLVAGLAAGVSKIMPRKYHVETRMLTQRNFIIASLANPGRSIPVDADQPTRAAWEMVMKSDNLKAVVRDAKLVEYWELQRSPMSRLKEKVLRKPPPAMTDDDKRDALTTMLEQAMLVMVEGGTGTVTIGVDWSDPQLALNIVEAAQKNFLEMRQAAEMGAVSEAITILDKQVVEEAEGIKQAIAALDATVKRVEAKRKREEARQAQRGGRGAQAQAGGLGINTNHLLAQMRFMVQTKRRAISDVEEFRARRLTELRNQLSEQRVIYSPQHPLITDLEQRIVALQEDSPQLVALRSELNELIGEYMRNGGDPGELEQGTTGPLLGAGAYGGPATSDNPEVSVAADRVRMLVMRHQEKMRRLDQAKTELEISRASMKHRFSVLAPPTFPEKPSKPKVQLILAAGVVGGIAMGIFAAVALDIIRRRILEKWQVERILKLPVLAELERR